MNSKEEALRRIKIAERHLREARGASQREDYPEVVGHAQPCVENSAKAIIACFRIPSWSHDPSGKLKESLSDSGLSSKERANLEKVAEYAHRLAPEHGRTDYGTRNKLPEEIYEKSDADDALRMAEESMGVAKKFLTDYFGK